LYGVTDLSRDCRGCETATLSVDRQLGHSFNTPKVPRDCLKVGLDFVSTDLQAVAARDGKPKQGYTFEIMKASAQQ